jgi:hypothetical protein
MNDDSAKEHNKKYLELTEEQYIIWRELMHCPTRDWAYEMRQWLISQHKGELYGGDSIGVWVADWVKYKFPINRNCPHYSDRKRWLRPITEDLNS